MRLRRENFGAGRRHCRGSLQLLTADHYADGVLLWRKIRGMERDSMLESTSAYTDTSIRGSFDSGSQALRAAVDLKPNILVIRRTRSQSPLTLGYKSSGRVYGAEGTLCQWKSSWGLLLCNRIPPSRFSSAEDF